MVLGFELSRNLWPNRTPDLSYWPLTISVKEQNFLYDLWQSANGQFFFWGSDSEIHVRDYGFFNGSRTAGNIIVDYNGSGSRTFKQATISSNMTFRMTAVALDQNATYQDQTSTMHLPGDGEAFMKLSRFNIIDFNGSGISLVEQNSRIYSCQWYGIIYSPKGNYFDLYVDDNLPTTLTMGLQGCDLFTRNGGSITVVDPPR